jgi:hypothetical protein
MFFSDSARHETKPQTIRHTAGHLGVVGGSGGSGLAAETANTEGMPLSVTEPPTPFLAAFRSLQPFMESSRRQYGCPAKVRQLSLRDAV